MCRWQLAIPFSIRLITVGRYDLCDRSFILPYLRPVQNRRDTKYTHEQHTRPVEILRRDCVRVLVDDQHARRTPLNRDKAYVEE
jgi:hypothetical protein